MRIDISSAKAAEAEAQDESHVIVFKGTEITLPPSVEMMPIDAIEAQEAGQVVGFIRGLVTPEDWDAFKAHRPNMHDLELLATAIGKVYGFEGAGESSASGGSLSTTGSSSRPTSPVSTISTSGNSAGGEVVAVSGI